MAKNLTGNVGICQKLLSSTPVVVTTDNTVIEGLHIITDGVNGIDVNAKNVVIKNCKIEYTGECHGIKFANSDNLTIDSCEITYTSAPAQGPLPNHKRNCISGFSSDSIAISHVRLKDGSSGIYLISCDYAALSYVEGYDMRGPFPRGQLVQWDKSKYGTLTHFSVINDRNVAWTEDNVNCFKSGGQIISQGLISGNNSPNGVGVLWEDQNYPDASGIIGGLVEDIDLIDMGNGACTAADSSGNITMRRIRVKDNVCTDLGQGRGTPNSNALIFSGYNNGYNITVEEATIWNVCNPNNIFWPQPSFLLKDYKEEDFDARAPIELCFKWCNGCADVVSTVFDEYKNLELEVLPNPSRGIVKISLEKYNYKNGYQVQLFNALGEQVYERKINEPSLEIDFSAYTNTGLYFLVLNDAEGVKIKTQRIYFE